MTPAARTLLVLLRDAHPEPLTTSILAGYLEYSETGERASSVIEEMRAAGLVIFPRPGMVELTPQGLVGMEDDAA